MRRIGGILLIAAAAAGLFALASAVAIDEGAPFVLRVQSLDRRVAMMSAVADNGSPISSLESRYARTAELDACLTTLRQMVDAGAQSQASIEAVTIGCLLIAEGSVARSPLESNVWYIGATLAARLGDLPKTSRFLLESYRTGPAEQWIAERRALFVYSLLDQLDPALNPLLDQDFALLLRTERGIRALAARYVSDTEMRDHLITVAETLDRPVQERFLNRVREAMSPAQ